MSSNSRLKAFFYGLSMKQVVYSLITFLFLVFPFQLTVVSFYDIDNEKNDDGRT